MLPAGPIPLNITTLPPSSIHSCSIPHREQYPRYPVTHSLHLSSALRPPPPSRSLSRTPSKGSLSCFFKKGPLSLGQSHDYKLLVDQPTSAHNIILPAPAPIPGPGCMCGMNRILNIRTHVRTTNISHWSPVSSAGAQAPESPSPSQAFDLLLASNAFPAATP